MSNETAFLYNAIVLLEEEGYTQEDILNALGMLAEEYKVVMSHDCTRC